MNRVKVAVTGAAGQIGYALLFRLASGQVFGANTIVDLHLLEIEPALPALAGVAMELEDCAFPTLGRVVMTADPAVAMAGVNYAVLVGSMPRKAGMERADLLEMNGKIFIGQGQAINAHAADDVKVFVVGNPCNTNCLIAMHHAPDVPRSRFFAMTMLDQYRAMQQLALRANVPVAAVANMIIWGNHSASQYPDFYAATINGQPALEVIGDETWLQEEFIPTVQVRGATVIKARGSSSAASAANGVIGGLRALAHDSDIPYSMCLCSEGQYGVDEGLIFSFPAKTQAGEVVVQTDYTHNAFGQARFDATLNELRQEYDAVKALKIIN